MEWRQIADVLLSGINSNNNNNHTVDTAHLLHHHLYVKIVYAVTMILITVAAQKLPLSSIPISIPDRILATVPALHLLLRMIGEFKFMHHVISKSILMYPPIEESVVLPEQHMLHEMIMIMTEVWYDGIGS